MWRILGPFSGKHVAKMDRKDMAVVASTGVLALAYLVVHCVFMVYFIVHNLKPLICINLASMLIYAIALLLNRNGRTNAAIFLMNAEICCYCVSNAVLLGWEASTQWFLPTAMLPCQILYPIDKRIKRFYLSLLSAAMLGCYLLRIYSQPVYDTNVSLVVLLNIITVVGATVICLEFSRIGTALTEAYYKQRIDNLSSDAYVDSLTGLWNRRYATEKLTAMTADTCQGGAVFSLAMLDVDFFKKVNDTHGHPFGDIVLRKLSNCIVQHFRAHDIAVRWGGEEFLIILPSTTGLHTRKKMEAFRHTIQNMVTESESIRQQITVTIGISEYHSGMSIHHAIEQSDIALYAGKNNGRNQVVLFSELPLDDQDR